MNKKWIGTGLIAMYALIFGMVMTSFVMISILWSFWSRRMAPESGDGCILFAMRSGSKFYGSKKQVCFLALYGLFPAMFVSVVGMFVHVFLVGIGSSLEPVRSTLTLGRCSNIIVEIILSVLLFIYNFTYAAFVMTAFFFTCNEYRETIDKSKMEKPRTYMECWEVYAYMDFEIPRKLSAQYEGDKVDTDKLFISVIAMQSICTALWMGILLTNIYIYYKRHIQVY